MRYRRHETLRYTFETPIPASFKIIKVDGKKTNTSSGKAHILDISPGGLKMATEMKISLEKPIQFFVETTISGINLTITANGIWSKPFGKSHHYGLDFLEDYHEDVVKALKAYKKQRVE
ncbi:PilZ domain-containing protein [Halobacillus fulvus]|nr:PilZ domain-containing protein [Halobacillus fulvus]